MASKYARKFIAPEALQPTMWDLTKEVLRAATEGRLPVGDKRALYAFAHQFFVEQRDRQQKRPQPPDTDDQLHSMLVRMFHRADTRRTGVLSLREFREALQPIAKDLALSDDEMMMLLSEADVNGDGVVEYEEFLPAAIGAIRSIFARDETVARIEQSEATAAAVLHGMPREQLQALMRATFDAADVNKDGMLSVPELLSVLRDPDLGLTRQEINLALLVAEESSDGRISFEEFAPLCIEMLHRATTLRTMRATLPQSAREVAEYLQALCAQADPQGRGEVHIGTLRALLRGADLGLTSVQISLLMRAARLDELDMVNYTDFCLAAAPGLYAMVGGKDGSMLAKVAELYDRGDLKRARGWSREALEEKLHAVLSEAAAGEASCPLSDAVAALVRAKDLRLTQDMAIALASLGLGPTDTAREGASDANLVDIARVAKLGYDLFVSDLTLELLDQEATKGAR